VFALVDRHEFDPPFNRLLLSSDRMSASPSSEPACDRDQCCDGSTGRAGRGQIPVEAIHLRHPLDRTAECLCDRLVAGVIRVEVIRVLSAWTEPLRMSPFAVPTIVVAPATPTERNGASAIAATEMRRNRR
jgi:hypothetical protein